MPLEQKQKNLAREKILKTQCHIRGEMRGKGRADLIEIDELK